jgi:hypothetical protein
MNVRELKKLLQDVPDHLDVVGEVSFDDGDGYESGTITSVKVEERCDEIPRLYIFADANPEDESPGEDVETVRHLRVVK